MTFSALYNDVQSWTERDDAEFASKISRFISLAESEMDADPILSKISYREQQADLIFYPDATGTADIALIGNHGCPGWYMTSDGELILIDENACATTSVEIDLEGQLATDGLEYSDSLPDDFLNIRNIRIQDVDKPLEYVPPDRFYDSEFHKTGNISVYTVQGRTIFVAPPPSGSKIGKLVYRTKLAPLIQSTTETDNWLSLNFYNVYLYKTLKVANTYLMDESRAGYWEGEYKKAAAEAAAVDMRMRYGGRLRKRGR